MEEFGPIGDIEMDRKWPNYDDDRTFSPPKGRMRTKKHQLTPSPAKERNVKAKNDSYSSEEDDFRDDPMDDELKAKFKKLKGKNKKVTVVYEKDDFIKSKSKKNKNRK